MKRFHPIISLITIISLVIIGGGVITTVHAHNRRAQQEQIIKHHKIRQRQSLMHHNYVFKNRKRNKHHNDRKYRIYSHHYLSVEHTDLDYLHSLGNYYAKDTNRNYQDSADNGNVQIYTKWYDHSYWSFFRDHLTYRPPHMNQKLFNVIDRRVLASHGVHHGVNFKNRKHKEAPTVKSGIAG